MKKLCLTILIVLTVCAVVPLVASADSATHNSLYTPSHGQYSLVTITNNGQPVGVRFFGYYFGGSGINVVVELYSSPELPLNFYIGDSNFNSDGNANNAMLTESQTETKQQLIALFEEVNTFINKVDECANTQYGGENGLPLSDIYRYNNAKFGDKLEISRETYEMLCIAKEMYNDTDGAFNPAVYRLVDLWGFSSRIYANGNFCLPYDRPVTGQYFAQNGYPLPEEKYVFAFSQDSFTNFGDSAVVLTQFDGKYFVTKNVAPAVVDGVEYQQWLDLGGIAKGYVVDCVKVMLESLQTDRYYIDAGSSSLCYGNGLDGTTSKLLLADPFDPAAAIFPSLLLGYEVGKSSVSNSGQYIRKYTVNGVEYSHIIDGTTGAPAQTGVKLVSVSIPESAGLWAGKGDCLTTALTVMGREKTVDFVNGYLKQNNITVVVAYETFDGEKQLLSNLDKNLLTDLGENFQQFAWTLKSDENGIFYYDANATFQKDLGNKTLLWVLVAIVAVCVSALLVYHFAKGKKRILQNVAGARKDKPFKPADVGVYLLVLLLILVLFLAFFGQDSNSWNTVQAVDIENGEQLFFYNLSRNEYKINQNNSNGWQVVVQHQADGLTVTFTREIDGETHFNTMKITRGTKPSVKMTESLCGFHQDCVHNFGAITMSGGAIVCSPNRLKVVTE